MIIVVSPSFEDHCVSTENPEADGNPSKETQKPKRPSIKPRVFLWEWAVMLVLASVCLSLGKKMSQIHFVTKHVHRHRGGNLHVKLCPGTKVEKCIQIIFIRFTK